MIAIMSIFIARAVIIGSRVNWYEQGEKSNKYFLNLENAKKKKSCIMKLHVDKDECTLYNRVKTNIDRDPKFLL